MSGAGGVIDRGARDRVESRVILTLRLMSGGIQGVVNAAKRFGLVLVALFYISGHASLGIGVVGLRLTWYHALLGG